MNLGLNLQNVAVDFKIDTGFDGECLVPYNIFDKLKGTEYNGPYVVLSDGTIYSTKAKIVELKYKDKVVYLECLSVPYKINKSLLGEKALKKLEIVIDYKSLEVRDP
ncbi:MAG: clan AA aspartic protease [Sulfolobaceae archaeon]|nr:clan AA aspartic protease [Sulfolobaceae archaeon]